MGPKILLVNKLLADVEAAGLRTSLSSQGTERPFDDFFHTSPESRRWIFSRSFPEFLYHNCFLICHGDRLTASPLSHRWFGAARVGALSALDIAEE